MSSDVYTAKMYGQFECPHCNNGVVLQCHPVWDLLHCTGCDAVFLRPSMQLRQVSIPVDFKKMHAVDIGPFIQDVIGEGVELEITD